MFFSISSIQATQYLLVFSGWY